jgi:hypothetical protein
MDDSRACFSMKPIGAKASRRESTWQLTPQSFELTCSRVVPEWGPELASVPRAAGPWCWWRSSSGRALPKYATAAQSPAAPRLVAGLTSSPVGRYRSTDSPMRALSPKPAMFGLEESGPQRHPCQCPYRSFMCRVIPRRGTVRGDVCHDRNPSGPVFDCPLTMSGSGGDTRRIMTNKSPSPRRWRG